MLVQEMHIEFDLAFKSINSNTFRRILSEEKDWFLNLAQAEYINNKRLEENDPKRVGNQNNRRRYEELQNLISTRSLSVYKFDTDTQYALLPDDLEMGTIIEGCTVEFSCKTFTVTENTTNLYKFVIPFVSSPTGLYASYIVDLYNTNTSSVVATLASHSTAITDIDLQYEVINEILWKLRQNTSIEVYWEQYGEERYDNSFIIITSSTNYASPNIIRVSCDSLPNQNITPTIITQTVLSSTGGTSVYSRNRLTKTDEVDTLNSFSFSKTVFFSPLAYIRSNKIFIKRRDNFIVKSLLVSYYSKPRPINITLEWNCQLTPGTHSEIVLIAARKAAAFGSKDNYNSLQNEQLILT